MDNLFSLEVEAYLKIMYNKKYSLIETYIVKYNINIADL